MPHRNGCGGARPHPTREQLVACLQNGLLALTNQTVHYFCICLKGAHFHDESVIIGAMKNAMTHAIETKFATLAPLLDERTRRLWAAVEARAIGRGGIVRVAEATGLSRVTIRAGVRELDTRSPADASRATTKRVRRPGGGRRAPGGKA